MAEKKGDNNPSSSDDKQRGKAADKQPVARTRLDIDIDDLIEPLSSSTAAADAPVQQDAGENRVAKTLLESDLPALEKIKELAESESERQKAVQLSESGRHSVAKTLLDEDFDVDVDVDSLSPEEFKAYRSRLAKTMPDPRKELVETQKQQPAAIDSKDESMKSSASIKELAKTIPDPASERQSSSPQSTEPEETAAVHEDSVSLKALAKTIPDPQMRERKAVAARIARIRSFQKTVQRKLPIFSKTVSNLDVLESLRESSSWKTSPASPSSSSSSSSSAPQQESQSASAGLSSSHVEAKSNRENLSLSSAPAKRKPPAREQFVAKTKLDHDILLQAVSESKHREEARVAALISERAKEPPKPPPDYVKADKAASPCPFVWNETDGKEKFRHCSRCQTAIYNFDGLERAEAEALVFSRENREKFTLYARTDGKFMTVDCPLQARRKKNLLFSLVAGLLLLSGAAALIMLMPPQSSVDTSPAGASPYSGSGDSGVADSDSDSVTGAPNAVAPRRGADGMITFSSTSTHKPVDPRKAPGDSPNPGGSPNGPSGYQTFKLPSVSDQSAQAPDPDEDGHFWKFE